MLAIKRNHIYEIKINSNDKYEEKIVSQQFLDECKKVSQKYPTR